MAPLDGWLCRYMRSSAGVVWNDTIVYYRYTSSSSSYGEHFDEATITRQRIYEETAHASDAAALKVCRMMMTETTPRWSICQLISDYGDGVLSHVVVAIAALLLLFIV